MNSDPATGLFREAALHRLSTSERLDRTLAVSSPKAWLALVMLVGMTVSVLGWSVLGEVSVFVGAPGILHGRGGVIVDAVSAGSGSLTGVLPAVGAPVEEGSVVAVIVDLEAREAYRTAVALVDENSRALEALKAAKEAENEVWAENASRQRRRYETMEQSARDAVDLAREFLEANERFLDEGLIARIDLGQSQRAFDQAQRELFSVLREREELGFVEAERLNRQAAEIADREAGLLVAKRTVTELEARLATHEILAPVTGRVVEIKASVGAVVGAGTPVLSIRPATETLEALIYVPPADGKRIVAGMEVLVSPASVRKEEYGAIRGSITEVAAFPASLPGMVAALQSQELAQTFSLDGPPYASRVSLKSDPLTASGLAWTSSRAALLTVSSGTLVEVQIEIDSQPPIFLVAPALRRMLGG